MAFGRWQCHVARLDGSVSLNSHRQRAEAHADMPFFEMRCRRSNAVTHLYWRRTG
jgi:hypothetical protein